MLSAHLKPSCAGLLLLLGLLSSAAALTAAQDAETDLSFEKSMDLLKVEMKLEVLRELYSSGYYIPTPWIARYREEYQNLSDDLGLAAQNDLGKVDAWSQEAAKVRKSEDIEMQKLAEKWGKKALLAAKVPLENLREWELQVNQWDKDKTVKSFHMAQAVIRLIHDQKPPAEIQEGYIRSVRDLYRGALGDAINLGDKLQALQRDRMELEASLQCCKVIDKAFKGVDFLQKSPEDHLQEEITKALNEYLERNYVGVDAETQANVKWTIGKMTAMGKKTWDTWDKLSALDNDRTLKSNPSALRTAKQFAMMGGLYDGTIGIVRDLGPLKAFGPFFDVLDFYGSALSLVPATAKKMAATVTKMDQDYLGLRKLDTWGKMPAEFAPYWNTSLRTAYGDKIDIATGNDLMEGAQNATYYLILPPPQGGYATLTAEQYDRLAATVAYERVLFARSEAESSAFWKGLRDDTWKIISHPVTHEGVTKESLAEELKTAIRNKARETPFSPPDLVSLAKGQAIIYRGATWTPQQFEDQCEKKMDELADECAIKTALGEFQPDFKSAWWDYKELLEKYQVVLSPPQILRIFGYYQANGPAAVERFLKNLAEQREARRLGVPSFKVYDVSVLKDWLPRGAHPTVEARAMVGDLAPGRTVEGVVTWTFSPAWAAAQNGPMRVTLKNGVNIFRRDLAIPKDAPPVPLTVKVDLTVPPGPGYHEPLTASHEENFGIDIVSEPEVKCEPSQITTDGGTVKIAGTFEVKGLGPDDQIPLKHSIEVPGLGAVPVDEEKTYGNGTHTFERTVQVPAMTQERRFPADALVKTPWGENLRGDSEFSVAPAQAGPPLVKVSMRLFTMRQRQDEMVAAQQILATDGSINLLADLQLIPPKNFDQESWVDYRYEITCDGKPVAHGSETPGTAYQGGPNGYASVWDNSSILGPDQYPFNSPHSEKKGTFAIASHYLDHSPFVELLRAGKTSFAARLVAYSTASGGRETVLADSNCSFQIIYRQFRPMALVPVRGYEGLLGRQGPGVAIATCELAGTKGHIRLVQRDQNSVQQSALDVTFDLPAFVDQVTQYCRYSARLEGHPPAYTDRGAEAHNGILAGSLGRSNNEDLTADKPESDGQFSLSCYTDKKANSIACPPMTVGLQLAGQRVLFQVNYDANENRKM